jgi:hypothetical protein
MYFLVLEAALALGALMPGGPLDRKEDAEKLPVITEHSSHTN